MDPSFRRRGCYSSRTLFNDRPRRETPKADKPWAACIRGHDGGSLVNCGKREGDYGGGAGRLLDHR